MHEAKKVVSRYWLALLLILAGIVWLINASKPGAEPIACFSACSKNDVSFMPEPASFLKVLSLNMLHDYPNYSYLDQRVKLLSQEIGRLDLDFVLLQEVPWTNDHGSIAHYLAEQNRLNAVYLRANGNLELIGFEEGVAILSRHPLKNLSFTELDPTAGFFENRIVLHATAVTPLGDLDLFVTHLTHSDASVNAAQAESLLSFVRHTAAFPAVVAGDFNAVEGSPQIRLLADMWQDSFRLAHPNDPGKSCCLPDLTHATAQDFRRRIDYLFTVPGAKQTIQIRQIQQIFDEPLTTTDGRLWVSDHAGLLATFTIGPAP